MASILYLLMSIRKKGIKTKGSYSLPWPPGFTNQLSEKAPHNVSWYKLVWSRNQCRISRTTSCSPLFTIYLIVSIFATIVKVSGRHNMNYKI